MSAGRKFFITAVAVLLAAAALYFPFKHRFSKRPPALINSGNAGKSVVLYFVNEDGTLVGLNREIVSGVTVLDDIRAIITEESSPQKKSGLLNAIPAGVSVRNVFIDDKQCVYIDFGRVLTERHGGGTQGELLTLEALKKTIAANYPELDSVKVLVEGKEIASLAGHISTREKMKVR